MKKITLVLLFLLLFSLLFSANVYAAIKSETEYKVGSQIELYLNSDTTFDITNLAPAGYFKFEIEDPTVAIEENGKLVAKSEGFTYISFTYKDYILHRNVIVHAGYEKVSTIKIDNTTANQNNSSIALRVGQEYNVLINNDESVKLSDTKVILQSPYEGIPVSEFIKISDEGALQIVGVGKFELTIKLPNNKKDGGIKVIVNTSFESSAFESAAIKYLEDNEYQLSYTEYDEKFITASELSLVEELTLTSVANLPTKESKKIFPNLKSVVVDLSGVSNTSLGKVVIKDECFEYKFIGNSGKTYTMQLDSNSMEYLKLSFENFKYSYGGTALNLKKVATADVFFYGTCCIKSNDSSGQTAVVGSKMNLALADGSKVEIRGGNGAASSAGAVGIEVIQLSIAAKEFSQTASINIYGGNGGSATSSSKSGGNGNIGIKATSLVVKGSISCNVFGGSGGNGKAGANQSSTAPSTPGQNSAGQKGITGTPGENGNNGGSGGNGAAAVSVITIQVIDVSGMKCTGGNGGDGASGGDAQNGGNGGKGGNTTGKGGSNAGDGGTGGTGGCGGRGGDGGDGSKALQIANSTDLKSCQNLSLVHGYGGNAGNGGKGGNAGNGGNGGDDDHGGGLFGWGEGPIQGSGGAAGTPGAGGQAGTAGKTVSSSEYFKISGITETTAKNPNKKSASNGSSGSKGTDGSDGDHGNLK